MGNQHIRSHPSSLTRAERLTKAASSFGFSRYITSTKLSDTNGENHRVQYVLAVGGSLAADQENFLFKGEVGNAGLFSQRLHRFPKVFHDLEAEQAAGVKPEAD